MMSTYRTRCPACGIAVACVFASFASAAVAADGQVEIHVGGGKANCGDVLKVPVELVRPNGLGALDVEFTYDPDRLEFENAESTAAVEDATFLCKQQGPGRIRCGLISAEPIEAEGVVFTLHFRGRDGMGDTTIRPVNAQAWQARNAFVLRVATEGGTWSLEQDAASPPGGPVDWRVVAAGVILAMALVFILGRASRKTSAA